MPYRPASQYDDDFVQEDGFDDDDEDFEDQMEKASSQGRRLRVFPRALAFRYISVCF